MTTCRNCGRHVDGDFPFCPYCRAELPPAPPAREQRKRVTVLFGDVTGSTALGESTDPEVLRTVLARYFERMKGIIESHGGTVEKFIGDAVMAVFGVPVLHEDDALRAARAAAEMRAALPELGIQARIGINSGEVVTGTRERLATGDVVNVAARLEQKGAPGEVLIGEETLRLIKDAVEIEAIEPLELKGKSEPVRAYRLLSVKPGTERRQLMTPMIGRKREVDRLQDAFAQAVDDRSCQLFTILGSAGVGKSRLSLEFLQRLDRARVVRGRCLSYGEGITYWPVIEVLRQLAGFPTDAYAASALQSLLGGSQAATSAEEIAWAFRKLLEEQAHTQPLVVVFDDIHWGEVTFLELVEHIADLSRNAPILLLCMARPDLLEKRPGWGGGKWNATTVLLEPLGARETDRLLDALGGVSDAMRERIRQAAEGNPLFVEEMVALLRAAGETEMTVPPTIHALLAARLDQLEPPERSVLECGAVEGRTFHRSAVTALLGGETDLPGRLVALVRKELIRPEAEQLSSDEAYRFRHLLIRDAAYGSLPKAVRAELHERLARWLEERDAARPEMDEIVGYHLEQAARYRQELGQPDMALADQAGKRLAAAGRRALWRGDERAARALLARALTLLRPRRLDVELELDLVDAQPTIQEMAATAVVVADRAASAGDRRGEAVAQVAVAQIRVALAVAGSIDDLEARARAVLPLLTETNDHAALVRVCVALGWVGLRRGRFEEGTQAIEQAISHARQIGQPGLFGLCFALIVNPRPTDEGLRTLDSLLGDEPHPYPRLDRAVLLAMLGRFEDARTAANEASARLRELTGRSDEGHGPMADIETLAGDHERAVHHWRICRGWTEDLGYQSMLCQVVLWLARSLCMLGQHDEAGTWAQRGRELGGEQDVLTRTLSRRVDALVLASRGEYQDAERLAREAVAIIERTDGLRWQGDALCDLAEVLRRAGRSQDAATSLRQALDRYERKRNVAMVTRVRQQLEASEDFVPLA